MYLLSAPPSALDVQRYALLSGMAELACLRREPGELFRDLAPRLRPVVPFDFLNFALFDSARKTMKMYFWDGAEWPREPLEAAVEEAAVGWVWRNQTELAIDDLLADERFAPEKRWLLERELRSYCVLPLATVRHKLGALGFGSKQAGAFRPDDVKLLHRVAEMVALSADNTLPSSTQMAELIAEKDRLLRQQQKQTGTLLDFAKGLVSSGAAANAGWLQSSTTTKGSDQTEAGDQVWFGASEALMESEQLLSAYFRASGVGLCILDPEFRYLAINQTMAEMNGIPAEAHLGKTVREMLGDFAELVEPQVKCVLETQQPILNLEISSTLPTRTEPGYWIEHYIPIRDATGKVKQIGVVAVEVTEQKRLEESIRGISEKLREEKKRQHVMLEVSRVLGAKWNAQQVFPKISAFLRRVLRQEYAALALHDEKTGQLIRQAMDFPLRKGPAVDADINPVKDPRGKALQEREPLIFNKDEMQEFPAGTADHLLAEGLQSLCCVPLLRPKGPLGVLVLGSTRANAFKIDDLTLLDQVAAQLAIALENARAAREVEQLRSRLEQDKRHLEGEAHPRLYFEEIIGESPALKEVLDQVAVVAVSDATVLLLGETGTGKGLVARAIHRASRRRDRDFISLNCAAIPTGLLESELFGHEKGAFTGAVSQKIGRLELADRGTLFLDEIGEIPLELQPKLLRVLQDHEFERLGGTRTIKVDMRLIAATNRDLAKSVTEKQFRSDLFYRLSVFPIRMPSLRERREDIPLLVRYFIRHFARAMHRTIETVPNETMNALINWRWPGNVRELENFIERSVILTEGTALRAPLEEFQAETSSSAEHTLEATEREHIIRVLRETGGMISGPTGAAQRLGLKRTTLQSKMRRLGITRQDYYFGKESD